MKTDELITMLSANVEPVDSRRVVRTVGAAVAIGAAAVVATVLFALGLRTNFIQASALWPLLLKLVFASAILAPALIFLSRLVRPGGEKRTPVLLVILPFVVIMLIAAASLTIAPRSHWNAMVIGDQWLECLISIPLIAVAPFAALVWAVRRMAPTDLARTGAVVGLIAGCLSAVGYALHCTDDFAPFVALWYGGTIALCAFAGWKLGPRLLRW